MNFKFIKVLTLQEIQDIQGVWFLGDRPLLFFFFFLLDPPPSGPMALLFFSSSPLFFYLFFWSAIVYKSTGYSFHSAIPAIPPIPTRLTYAGTCVHSYISPRRNKRPTNYRIDKTLGLWINFQSLSALACTNLSNLKYEWQVVKDQRELLFLCFFSPRKYSI